MTRLRYWLAVWKQARQAARERIDAEAGAWMAPIRMTPPDAGIETRARLRDTDGIPALLDADDPIEIHRARVADALRRRTRKASS